MESLSSEQLITVKHKMESENALFTYLKKYARTDSDYFNELIGTLALREENYQKATTYLASVSGEYLRTMNIYKAGYFRRDPFYGYHLCGWSKNEYGKWETKINARKKYKNSQITKYQFAKRMLSLQNQMKYGKTADERGIARLKYAIGRRNSFEECWALTQYWRGGCLGWFFENYDNNDDLILYDYEEAIGSEKTEEIYKNEVKKALAMLQSNETKAEAEYMLGNLITIIRYYGNTKTALHIKTSCDNWRSWL